MKKILTIGLIMLFIGMMIIPTSTSVITTTQKKIEQQDEQKIVLSKSFEITIYRGRIELKRKLPSSYAIVQPIKLKYNHITIIFGAPNAKITVYNRYWNYDENDGELVFHLDEWHGYVGKNDMCLFKFI